MPLGLFQPFSKFAQCINILVHWWFKSLFKYRTRTFFFLFIALIKLDYCSEKGGPWASCIFDWLLYMTVFVCIHIIPFIEPILRRSMTLQSAILTEDLIDLHCSFAFFPFIWMNIMWYNVFSNASSFALFLGHTWQDQRY